MCVLYLTQAVRRRDVVRLSAAAVTYAPRPDYSGNGDGEVMGLASFVDPSSTVVVDPCVSDPEPLRCLRQLVAGSKDDIEARRCHGRKAGTTAPLSSLCSQNPMRDRMVSCWSQPECCNGGGSIIPNAFQMHRTDLDHMSRLFALQDSVSATSCHPSDIQQFSSVDHVVVCKPVS